MSVTVIAITGASSGIGAATAELLAADGAQLVLGARRADRLDALADRLGAVAVPVDVRRREDLETLVNAAQERFGRLDVLVSNAGIGPIGPFDALEVDAWDAMIDVNLRGVLHGIAAALPVFREQGSGHFVTVASTAGLKVTPGQGVYAATKTAVRVVMEGLRQEAGDALRVTTVSPGFVRTAFAEDIADPALRERIAEGKRTLAMPAEAVARAIAYAIGQPPDVDVGEIVIRPTAQG